MKLSAFESRKNCILKRHVHLLKGPSSKQTQNKSKHRSQESISSQNTNKSASQSRRDKVRGELYCNSFYEVKFLSR